MYAYMRAHVIARVVACLFAGALSFSRKRVRISMRAYLRA